MFVFVGSRSRHVSCTLILHNFANEVSIEKVFATLSNKENEEMSENRMSEGLNTTGSTTGSNSGANTGTGTATALSQTA